LYKRACTKKWIHVTDVNNKLLIMKIIVYFNSNFCY